MYIITAQEQCFSTKEFTGSWGRVLQRAVTFIKRGEVAVFPNDWQATIKLNGESSVIAVSSIIFLLTHTPHCATKPMLKQTPLLQITKPPSWLKVRNVQFVIDETGNSTTAQGHFRTVLTKVKVNFNLVAMLYTVFYEKDNNLLYFTLLVLTVLL